MPSLDARWSRKKKGLMPIDSGGESINIFFGEKKECERRKSGKKGKGEKEEKKTPRKKE